MDLTNAKRLLAQIPTTANVGDVGGGASPFPRANYVIDAIPFSGRGINDATTHHEGWMRHLDTTSPAGFRSIFATIIPGRSRINSSTLLYVLTCLKMCVIQSGFAANSAGSPRRVISRRRRGSRSNRSGSRILSVRATITTVGLCRRTIKVDSIFE